MGYLGEIDVWANDIYLRHIYTSFVSPYSLFTRKPTHTIVLGDLFSSQWIGQREFNERVKRYKWIFGDTRKVSLISISFKGRINFFGCI